MFNSRSTVAVCLGCLVVLHREAVVPGNAVEKIREVPLFTIIIIIMRSVTNDKYTEMRPFETEFSSGASK